VDLVRLLRKLVACPTDREAYGLQLWVADLLADLGFDVSFHEISPGKPAVYGVRAGGDLLLCSHVDTVPALEHPEPCRLRVDGDRLIGRGTVDAKGQVAALLYAVSRTRAPCQVLITADEEDDAFGSERAPVKASAAVVLEPTRFEVAVAQAGYLEIELTVRGRSGHGVFPDRLENAIVAAFAAFNELTRLPLAAASHPLIPGTWLNPGRIEGGAGPMVVPWECRLEVDVGVLPPRTAADAITELSAWAESRGLGFRVLDQSDPFELDPEQPLVKKLLGAATHVLGRTPALTGYRAWTDAENLNGRGIPAVIFGAGDLVYAHSAEEWVSLADLEALSRILIRLVEDWSGP
jgi:acetylornithine deacetylase/succinyl-diaminopimelate desuccinylase-like protein